MEGADIVVECDRCPRELRVPRGTGLGAVVEYTQQWCGIAVARGAVTKAMTLCPDCARAFRMFMLSSEVRS